MNINEHKFLADFQPFGQVTNLTGLVVGTALNWVALYGVFYVAGLGLKHGLGN